MKTVILGRSAAFLFGALAVSACNHSYYDEVVQYDGNLNLLAGKSLELDQKLTESSVENVSRAQVRSGPITLVHLFRREYGGTADIDPEMSLTLQVNEREFVFRLPSSIDTFENADSIYIGALESGQPSPIKISASPDVSLKTEVRDYVESCGTNGHRNYKITTETFERTIYLDIGTPESTSQSFEVVAQAEALGTIEVESSSGGLVCEGDY